MTFPRFAALNRQWRKHPPVSWLVAAQIGYKPPREKTAPAEQQPQWTGADLKRMFPDGLMK